MKIDMAEASAREYTDAELLAYVNGAKQRRRALADRLWSEVCDRVLEVVARAKQAERQRDELVWGLWSMREVWITDVEFAVRLLVQRGRREGRLATATRG